MRGISMLFRTEMLMECLMSLLKTCFYYFLINEWNEDRNVRDQFKILIIEIVGIDWHKLEPALYFILGTINTMSYLELHLKCTHK